VCQQVTIIAISQPTSSSDGVCVVLYLSRYLFSVYLHSTERGTRGRAKSAIVASCLMTVARKKSKTCSVSEGGVLTAGRVVEVAVVEPVVMPAAASTSRDSYVERATRSTRSAKIVLLIKRGG